MIRSCLAAAVAALAWLPAPAAAVAPHGPVDFGDRVSDCEKAPAVVRVTLGERTVDGPQARGCVATVPSYQAVTDAGWQPGDPIDIALVSEKGTVPLRFARMEADLGAPAAGTPEVVPAGDQDTGERDMAVALDPGDAVSLGRVDLRRADGLALRLCIAGADTSDLPPNAGPLLTPQRAEPPTFISVRQDGPDGAALVHPIDVASDPQELSRLSTLGFGGCYRLVVLPITGRVQEDSPELFLRAESGAPGVLRVNSVDVTGTGAKLPVKAPPALQGMRTIFDGTSFDGWEHVNCALRDGAAVNARSGDNGDISGCSLVWPKPLRDVVLRLRMRREHIVDNAGIYLGAQEIQLRSVGEYLPGGYFGAFAARWQKLSAFPDYDEIEIVQVGARHVVTVNGRTVTDVVRADGPPEPYVLNVIAQPQWSYRFGGEVAFGGEGFPDTTKPAELGAFWFKDVRLLECDGPDDPVCRRLADARRGQVPVPDGAPPPLPRERPRSARCTSRRALVVKVARGLRRLRATVGGRRAKVRRTGPRRIRVTLPRRARGRALLRITGRTRSGRLVRIERTVRPCR